MPLENEIKFILEDRRGTLEAFLAGVRGLEAADIFQVYLEKGTRIRRFTPLDGGPPAYMFSFKRGTGGMKIEIETEISGSDFNGLLPDAQVSLTKRRYKVADGEVHWDIDFLKNSAGETYFAVAEAEMPGRMLRPDRILPFVSTHLLLDVGRESGFGNRRLADETYVRRVLKELRAAARREGRTPGCDPGLYQIPAPHFHPSVIGRAA